MSRVLLEVQAKTRLSLGKSIAQLLAPQHEAGDTVLRWIVIANGDCKGYGVTYCEVFDEGSEDNFDITGFSQLEPDDGCVTNEFDTVEEALEFAGISYGASMHKYVAENMIDEEYADYFRKQPNR